MGRAEARRYQRELRAGRVEEPKAEIATVEDITAAARHLREAELTRLLEPEGGFVPGHFRGNPLGYASFFEVPARRRAFSTQALWCPEHWAPCPVEGRDGRAACVALLKYGAEKFMPPNLVSMPARMRWLERQTVPLCCQVEEGFIDMLWMGVPVI